jgi:hypothetical protein
MYALISLRLPPTRGKTLTRTVGPLIQADSCVEDYNVQNGATIHLVLRLGSGDADDGLVLPVPGRAAGLKTKGVNTTTLELTIADGSPSTDDARVAGDLTGKAEDLSPEESEGLLKTLGLFKESAGDEIEAPPAFEFKKEEEESGGDDMDEEQGADDGEARSEGTFPPPTKFEDAQESMEEGGSGNVLK